jgi:hypothetical protein
MMAEPRWLARRDAVKPMMTQPPLRTMISRDSFLSGFQLDVIISSRSARPDTKRSRLGHAAVRRLNRS